MSDIYCEQILPGRVPVEVVLETEQILAFHHTNPYFERHIVVIPKSHIDSLSSLESLDPELAKDFMKAIHEISSDLERELGGCRVCSNVGSYQNSKHLHWNIHAGKRLRAEDGTVLGGRQMLQYKINFDNIEWESPVEGVKCKTYNYENRHIRLIEYTKKMPPHWCEIGHYGLILEGELEIEYANEKLIYKEGDGVFIPDGAAHKHKGRVITESVKVIFIEDV